ncbi:MAG: CoA transferase [Acidimicrobiia bacterium]
MEPLGRLTVIEATGDEAVALAGGLLARFGADVVMLEPPEGCPARTRSAFPVWAAGKHSVVVDDVAAALAQRAPAADLVVTDEATWVAAGQPRARLVTVVVGTGFGEGGLDGPPPPPEVRSSAAEAVTGILHAQQGSRPAPFFLVEPAAALGAALLAVTGALAVLPAAPGAPQLVRTSYVAGALGAQLFSATVSPTGASLPELDGDPRRITTPLIRFFEAADGWILLGAVSVPLWVNICLALDRPDLLVDPRFEGAPFGIAEAADRVALTEEIQAVLRTRSVADWLARFRAEGVIASPVLEPGEALEVDQVVAIGGRAEVDDPQRGPLVVPGTPFALDGARPATRPAPPLGRHDPALLARGLPGDLGSPADPDGPPLAGLRVVDLGTFAAAPGASVVLGGLGAEVAKVESPSGDPFRALGYSFVSVNRGKTSAVVELDGEDGRRRLRDLVGRSDLLLHNFRSTLAEKLGLPPGDDDLGAIECCVTGFGATGPDRGLPSIDAVFESLTGGPLVQGGGTAPVGYSGGFIDNTTSLFAACVATAALVARWRWGTRPSTEVSLLTTALFRHADLLVTPGTDWRAVTLGPDPVGPTATHRLYPARDGWILLGVADDEGWRALRRVVPGLADRFDPGDRAWSEATEQVLGAAVAAGEVDELLAAWGGVGVPAYRAQDFKDFALGGRDRGDLRVTTVEDAAWGTLLSVDQLIDVGAGRWRRLGSAPALGGPLDGDDPIDAPGG